MPLRVTYHTASDFVRDSEQQFALGGLLVRIEPPASLGPFASTELELITPVGQCTLEVQILQIMPGVGVAVGFSAADVEELVAEARSAGQDSGEEPTHEFVESLTPVEEDPGTTRRQDARAAAENAFTRVKKATKQEKMHMAMHGTKAERVAILRDTNKTLHQYVIRSPSIQLDEVTSIARNSTISAEVLKYIAERREWYSRPEVAASLVRNPKTPVPVAVKMLKFVSKMDLRQIAKGNGVRSSVASAARKQLLR